VTTATLSAQSASDLLPRQAAGAWQAVAAHSHASFTARVAGRAVRGRLPLSGEASVGGRVEECATTLVASTGQLSTVSPILDKILTGPGFLEAAAFPEISFRSEQLTRVPTGWRAIGQLHVKGVDHELACQLTLGTLHWDDEGTPRLSAKSHWVLDSTWITGQRIPGLSRRVSITCFVVLEPSH
jgi:polyisoprenoid-binding protein YceI